jgi:hypothetical protein
MVHNGVVKAEHDAIHQLPAPVLSEKERATTKLHTHVKAEHDAVHQLPAPVLSVEKPGASQPHWGLWLYVTGLSVLLLGVLFCLFLSIPQVPEHKPGLSATEEAAHFHALQHLFVMTLGMTLCCGALGGCLFNMRGLIKHTSEKDFEIAYQLAYIMQPFAGAVSGFIVFLILVSGLLSIGVQPPHPATGDMEWIFLKQQLPFMAFATLAGYASHVFMMKLKDIAEVIFSIPERVNPVTKTNEKPLGGTAQ